MDLFKEAADNDPVFDAQLREHHMAQLQQGEQPVDRALALTRYNNHRRTAHRNNFPLTENLYALIFIVLADLSESQRERLTSTLTLRGFDVQTYTFDVVREVFIELFCMPRSSLDNPTFRTGAGPKAFCILDQKEM